MHKVLLVAVHEYLQNLRRPSYLFSAFGTPLIIVVLWGVIFIFAGNDEETTTFQQIGYVDQGSGLALVDNQTISVDAADDGADEASSETQEYTFLRFESEEAAQQALQASDNADTQDGLDAYFVISPDYQSTAQVQLYSYDDPPESLNTAFRKLLLTALSEEANLSLPLDRLVSPIGELTVFTEDSGRELSRDSFPVVLLGPVFFAILFTIAVQTTSTFLVNGLVQEKTNRIMEILVTSISPMQLLLGKILGLGSLGFTQVSIWIMLAAVFYIAGPQIAFLSIFDGVALPVDLILVGILYFVIGYFFVASILAGIGVIAGSEQQGNQYAAIITLAGYFGNLFALTAFIEDPNGTIPVLLSMIPLTSPMAMVIRVGFTSVPVEQIALSLGILIVSTVIVAWAAGKVFRWGLLLYGKKISPRDIWGVIRGQREPGTTTSDLQRQEGTA